MSTPSSILRVELQGIGENLNTWGYPRLNNALQRLEEAAHGLTTIALSAAGARILASANYVADEARAPILILTGAPAGAVEIIVPGASHWWMVDNRTTGGQSVTIKTAAGAGYTLRPGPQAVICDGDAVFGMSPRLDQAPLAAATVDLNGQRLSNLSAPAAANDAARKADVDAVTAAVAADAQTATEQAQIATDAADDAQAAAQTATEQAQIATDAAADALAATASVQRGQANGVAELDATGKLPASRLPAHAHVITDVTGLQTALDGKAAASLSNVTNTDFANKALAAGVGGAVLPLTTVTGTSAALTTNTAYVANNAARVTLTLPTTAAVGAKISVFSLGAGGWQIAQNAGQSIIWGGLSTTAGVTDGLKTVAGGGAVTLVCVAANTTWEVESHEGPLTFALTSTQQFDATNKHTSATLSNSNMTAYLSAANIWGGVRAFAIPSGGRYYFEFKLAQLGTGSNGRVGVGVVDTDTRFFSGSIPWDRNGHTYLWQICELTGVSTSNVINNSTGTNVAYGAKCGQGDVIGVAVDTAAGKVWFSRNGVWQGSGNPETGVNPAISGMSLATALYPFVGFCEGPDSVTLAASASALTYTPPSGFSRLP